MTSLRPYARANFKRRAFERNLKPNKRKARSRRLLSVFREIKIREGLIS